MPLRSKCSSLAIASVSPRSLMNSRHTQSWGTTRGLAGHDGLGEPPIMWLSLLRPLGRKASRNVGYAQTRSRPAHLETELRFQHGNRHFALHRNWRVLETSDQLLGFVRHDLKVRAVMPAAITLLSRFRTSPPPQIAPCRGCQADHPGDGCRDRAVFLEPRVVRDGHSAQRRSCLSNSITLSRKNTAVRRPAKIWRSPAATATASRARICPVWTRLAAKVCGSIIRDLTFGPSTSVGAARRPPLPVRPPYTPPAEPPTARAV